MKARISAPVGVRILVVLGVLAAMLAPQPSFAGTVVDDSHRPGFVNEIHALRASMVGGNTYGDQVREAQPRSDGYRHIDTPKLIAKLRKMNVNLYLFQIWNSPTDWQDLTEEFAPAAQAVNIKVWPYIVPPSECQYFDSAGQPLPRVQRGRCSQPYGEDYVAWADAVARLSVQYPVVTGWAIDDFSIGVNSSTFTPEYMQRIKAAQDAVRPGLQFLTTAYLGAAQNDAFLDKYAPYITGVIYPYLGTRTNTVDPSEVGQNIDLIVPHTKAHGLDLLLLAYANRYVTASPHPNADYVNAVIQGARSRIRDGSLRGVIAYGAPMDGTPSLNSDARSRSGVGRLSLSVSSSTRTGSYASASTTIHVDPNATYKSISFWHTDQWARTAGLSGYHIKQLLVDGQPAWSSDVMDSNQNEWKQATVDLTSALAGKTQATLTFRLFEQRGVSSFPVDVSFDDAVGQGITLDGDGAFEAPTGWTLESDHGGVQPLVDVWSADMQNRIAGVIATNYAEMAHRPVPTYEDVQSPPPANRRSMYGEGRLSLSVGNHAPTTAGQCASASQVVQVQPSPRYELSFWVYDQWLSVPGYHAKQVLIDNTIVYNQDVADYQHNDWLQGAGLQGAIDVTDQVSGKPTVTVTLRLCEKKGVVDYPVDLGFDNLTTVGLPLVNPGFDEPGGWDLSSQGNLVATIDR